MGEDEGDGEDEEANTQIPTKLVVFGLHADMDDAGLYKLFSKYGCSSAWVKTTKHGDIMGEVEMRSEKG